MRSTLEKYQVLKLKLFLFIDSDASHKGEYVLHTSICALIASTQCMWPSWQGMWTPGLVLKDMCKGPTLSLYNIQCA